MSRFLLAAGFCGMFAWLMPSASFAGGPVLELGQIEVLPGQEDAPLPIFLTSDQAVNAVTMRILYEDSFIHLRGVSLEGGVLENETFDFMDVDLLPLASSVTIQWTLDGSSPYTNEIPAGLDMQLASLLFDIDTLLLSGNSADVQFAELSTSSVKNRVYVDGVASTPTMIDGSVTIRDDFVFLMHDDHARQQEVDQPLLVYGFNPEGAQGYSLAIGYDPSIFEMTDAQVEDDVVQAFNPEFIETIIDNNEGSVIVGVLFDLLPPFDDHGLPAAGLVYELARLTYDVYDEAPLGQTSVAFIDGLGSPAIDNIWVVGNQSLYPTLESADFQILGPAIFVRGDVSGDGTLDIQDPILELSILFIGFRMPDCQKAMDSNDDGDVDLADPIFALYYLFTSGPAPPEPFPEPGLDPTPDDIPCD